MAKEKQKTEDKKEENVAEASNKSDVSKENTEKKSSENKEEKIVEKKQKVKKTEAVVSSFNLPISTIESVAVCKFIKGKKIKDAISDLEKVAAGKKAVPMKGEIPHRKGRIMSGRFPKKSAKYFIKVLKSLSGNVIVNEIDNPVIFEAVANIGQRPYGRFGAVRRKRTHLKIIAKPKKLMEAKQNKKWKKKRLLSSRKMNSL